MTSILRDPVVAAFAGGMTVGAGVLAAVLTKMAAEAKTSKGAAAAAGTSRRGSSGRLDRALDGSPVVRRAIALTANLAERRGLLGSVERSLRTADVPLRPAELIFAYCSLAVIVPISVLALVRKPQLVALSIIVFAIAPPLALKSVVVLRRNKFVKQLPDALAALASALRAGRSLGQAIDGLSRDMPSPIGRELRKISAEVRLGRKLAEALEGAAERMGSRDFRWAVLAMQIQAEVGGNLAELLDRVGETMRARARLKGDVKALTAEGRASAMMLVVMPPALGLVMFAVNPDYMRPLVTETAGQVMLGVSALMITGGFFWMKKMVTIDV